MVKLGVNIDHIATLRNARGEFFPSLIYVANIVEKSGGDFITIHLREDRRHIKDGDLYLLKDNVTTYINLEMACNEDVLNHAIKTKPYKVTLVPEKREEKTTEGGLDISTNSNFEKIKKYIEALKNNDIKVSLFVEPDINNINKILELTPDDIEIHTGKYSNLIEDKKSIELNRIKLFAKEVYNSGINVCAGHGLNYHNVYGILEIGEIEELNIGYSIVTRSIFDGLEKAIVEMKRIINLYL